MISIEPSCPPLIAPAANDFSGWFLDVLPETESTNQLAARLPAWHAVRAETQTAGRGRTGRHWVSDPGGLWLSAVLPCPGPREAWSMLPLAAGWAVIAALADLGVSDLRLRWPNDILAGRRKLAGLLVERHTPDTAVVGIGLNVFNHPEASAPALRDATARLADLAALDERDLDAVAAFVLRALAHAHAILLAGDFPRIAADLNRTWGQPRLVALTLAGGPAAVVGLFSGIDEHGHLRLSDRIGQIHTYDATQVAHLRELEG
ncbi:MAG: biotin--[acetyl-CoA-carboxylase] ligase [Burkholderiales bacterium]|nr:biotin--[acetyl-CoA-carboxylase] ligase [Opitutaceae bacterium]